MLTLKSFVSVQCNNNMLFFRYFSRLIIANPAQKLAFLTGNLKRIKVR